MVFSQLEEAKCEAQAVEQGEGSSRLTTARP